MWIGLAVPFMLMIGAMGLQRLEPASMTPAASDDPLQQNTIGL
ncbi:hypothetical protein [Actinokineospora sp. NBRC 105648]|nr:hypothetical protein [Actinokineospora sp. NBRC 105648]GLZ39292.1 hypothetical protein Acsp05_29160 [Actinokineospora sp. NBRC 105648]